MKQLQEINKDSAKELKELYLVKSEGRTMSLEWYDKKWKNKPLPLFLISKRS
jgi:hypothetical protein